jgi:hypothetical protein
MTVEEIINLPPDKPVDVADLIGVVEYYIRARKGRDVQINLLKGINPSSMLFAHAYAQQVSLLVDASNYAGIWLKENHKF